MAGMHALKVAFLGDGGKGGGGGGGFVFVMLASCCMI